MAYSRYYRRMLTPEEKPFYDALVVGFKRMNAEICVPYAPHLNIDRSVQAVHLDYPELFYVDFSSVVYCRSLPISKIMVSYHVSARIAREQSDAIDRAATSLARDCAGKPLLETEQLLHDRLVKLCAYGTVPGREHDAHNIRGAFLDHLCVCEGYAKAYKYLCDMAKLQCLVVLGDATPPFQDPGPHAWNMVNLNGNVYHVDVTFDRLIDDQFISKAYFNLSDDQIRYDHMPYTSMFSVPASPISGTIIPMIGGTRQLMDYLRIEHARHVPCSEVLLTKGFPENNFLPMMQNKLSAGDRAWFYSIKASYYRKGARSLVIVWR